MSICERCQDRSWDLYKDDGLLVCRKCKYPDGRSYADEAPERSGLRRPETSKLPGLDEQERRAETGGFPQRGASRELKVRSREGRI